MRHNMMLYRELLGEFELFPFPQRAVAEMVEAPQSLIIGPPSVAQLNQLAVCSAIVPQLAAQLEISLPSIEDIEAELSESLKDTDA